LSLRALLDKFSRAALFGASMNNLGEAAQYAVLFSYWFVLLVGGLIGNATLLATGGIVAMIRLAFASGFWSLTQAERRLFWEVFISDLFFLYTYFRVLITRRLVWGGIE
jgi:hypothetical protein